MFLKHLKIPPSRLKEMANLHDSTYRKLLSNGWIEKHEIKQICDALGVSREDVLFFPVRLIKLKVLKKPDIEERIPIRPNSHLWQKSRSQSDAMLALKK
jgi:hypothetical protein